MILARVWFFLQEHGSEINKIRSKKCNEIWPITHTSRRIACRAKRENIYQPLAPYEIKTKKTKREGCGLKSESEVSRGRDDIASGVNDHTITSKSLIGIGYDVRINIDICVCVFHCLFNWLKAVFLRDFFSQESGACLFSGTEISLHLFTFLLLTLLKTLCPIFFDLLSCEFLYLSTIYFSCSFTLGMLFNYFRDCKCW